MNYNFMIVGRDKPWQTCLLYGLDCISLPCRKFKLKLTAGSSAEIYIEAPIIPSIKTESEIEDNGMKVRKYRRECMARIDEVVLENKNIVECDDYKSGKVLIIGYDGNWDTFNIIKTNGGFGKDKNGEYRHVVAFEVICDVDSDKNYVDISIKEYPYSSEPEIVRYELDTIVVCPEIEEGNLEFK